MRVFLIAGEPSGDRLGAALMAGLRTLGPAVSFDGIGGPLMQGMGLQSRFPMDELSVMGIAEIAPKYLHLKRRIRETAAAVEEARPDVLVTIDSPDFVFRVAALLHRARWRPRIVHYVAPTVWAWRPKRAVKVAGLVDQLLALFPFEPPYFEAHGLRCDFVGHPVVAEPEPSADEEAALREATGLGDAPVLLALPGSRRGEVTRMMPVFGAVLERVREARPDLRVLIPAAPSVADEVAARARDWPGAPVVLDTRGRGAEDAAALKRGAFRAGRAALATSGTVSLELAAARTPMVIAYDFNWITLQIVRRMALVDTVTLVNLVSETRAVPEFLGADCRPERIVPALLHVLAGDPGQEAAMTTTMERLGRGGEDPGLRAARAVLDGLGTV